MRPLLEYCSAVWNPKYVTEIRTIESVQRMFTKRIYGLHCLSYSERLLALHAESLELRRLKADLLMVFKIIFEFSAVDKNLLFKLSNSNTRGHSYRLTKAHCSLNCRQHSFACHCVNIWNSLPNDVFDCKCVTAFKHKLLLCDFIKFLVFFRLFVFYI